MNVVATKMLGEDARAREESQRTLATLASAYRVVLPDLDLDPCACHILGCLEKLPGRPLVHVA